VEVVEAHGSDSTTDAGGDGLAGITNEVGDLEDLGAVLLVLDAAEVPVVRELEGETGVVGGLDGDDIGHEVRAELESEGLDDVRALGLVTRERQDGELFVGAKHDKIGTPHDARLLLLVVVDLHGSVVGSADGDDAGAIASAGSGVEGSEQLLDGLGQLLGPELLVGRELVGLADDRADLTGLDVAQ